MFLCYKNETNSYMVYDTSDKIFEEVPIEDLNNLILNGSLEVFGMTEFCISAGTVPRVAVRLRNQDGSLKDFDGYMLRDADFYYNACICQVIDYKDCADCFDDVFVILRHINKMPSLITHKEGYIIDEYCNGEFVLTDKETGESFGGCTFSTCVYIYADEHKSIQGISYLDFDRLVYNGETLLLKDELSLYSSLGGISVERDEDIVSSIEYSWSEADKGYKSIFDSCGTLTLSNGVVVNDLQYGLSESDFNSPLSYMSASIVGIENGNILLSDGRVVSDIEDILPVIGAMDFSSVEVQKGVWQVIEAYASKIKILRGTNIKHRLLVAYSKKVGSISDYFSIDFIRSPVNNVTLSTAYGNINLKFSHSEYENIWLCRYTHLGSVWYNLKLNVICTGTMSQVNDSNLLVGENFLTLLSDFENMWLDDTVCPILPTRVEELESGVCIYIACLVSNSPIGFGETGLGMIELPLILCGGNLLHCNGFYKYNTLFGSLTFDSKLFSNLCCNYSVASDGGNIYKNSSRGTRKSDAHNKILKRVWESALRLYNSDV